MKKTLLFLPLLLLFLFEVGCKKDSYVEPAQADTLFPRAYLPLYPGSHWTYRRISDSTLFTDSATAWSKQRADDGAYHSHVYVVPGLNGVPHFGYCFNKNFYSTYEGRYNGYTRELDETAGASWTYEKHAGDIRYNYWNIYRQTDSTGITMTVGATTFTNVIRVHEWSIPGGSTSGHWYSWHFYYAKDIGLIEKDVAGNNGYAPEFVLDSYFILH